MAVKVAVDSIEEVDEPLRAYYVQSDDGKFRLDGVDDTGALKRALEREKAERKTAKEALEKFKDLDPDEYQKLKQEREEREVQAATKKGEYEKLRVQLVEKHQKELTSRDSRVGGLLTTIQALMVDEQATRAIAAAKGVPELLLPHVRSQVRVVEEDGVFAVKVVDRSGNQRIGDADGQPMTIQQLVNEMRASDVFGRAFEGSGATGSGTKSSAAGGGGPKTIARAQFDSLSQYERAARVKDGYKVVD